MISARTKLYALIFFLLSIFCGSVGVLYKLAAESDKEGRGFWAHAGLAIGVTSAFSFLFFALYHQEILYRLEDLRDDAREERSMKRRRALRIINRLKDWEK